MIPDTIASHNNVAATTLQAGAALAAAPTLQEHAGRLVAFVPNGLKFEDFSKLLPEPVRLEQVVTLETPDAFAAYVALFADSSRSIVFAQKAGRFSAVLDYHATPSQASWNGHRANLTLTPTLAWTEWFSMNRKAMSQADFAQFLEDRIPDIATPPGADLLEVARNFEAKKGVTFQSNQRASDGAMQFTFNEDVQGSARAGTMKVPTEFTLGLAPFEGSAKYAVIARLRFRIADGGKLSIWYDLVRVQDVVDSAFAGVLANISQQLNGKVRAIVLGTI